MAFRAVVAVACLGLPLTTLTWWSADDPVPPPAPVVAAAAGSRVHDPCLIQEGNRFILFATGRGVPIRTSTDLVHWERAGSVFADNLPAWARAEFPQARDLWAPDILWWAGEYRLYYSVSSFGSQRSAIGLATNRTLDPASPSYHWVDQGQVIDSRPGRDNFNAIDPNVIPNDPADIVRDPQRPWLWLSFGSFWGGIQIVALDAATGKPDPARWGPPRTIAARPGDHAIEAPFLYHHDGWYYLFASVDHCCRGASSDYNVVVGRSRTADGVYLDLDGKPLTEGGGSPVLASMGAIRGPGHNAVLRLTNGAEVFAHHYYDADDRGLPKLQVRRLVWGTDGWPLAGEVVDATTTDPRLVVSPVNPRITPSRWSYSSNFGIPRLIKLQADGTIADDIARATWRQDGRTLTLDWGAGMRDECIIAPDGHSFIGRNPAHAVVRGRVEPD